MHELAKDPEKLPGGQGEHVVAPALEYVLGGQNEQAGAIGDEAYKPAAHCTQAEPICTVPSGHLDVHTVAPIADS